MDSAGS